MKTSTVVLITALAMAFTDSAIADDSENIMPPSGPYRSLSDIRQSSTYPQDASAIPQNPNYPSGRQRQNTGKMPGQHADEIPDSEKQRMMQMEQWMKQQMNQSQAEMMNQHKAMMDQRRQQFNLPAPQMQPNTPPLWNHNQIPPMPHPDSGQLNMQNNNTQQYFPSARGPVYGPGVPPPGFNGQPGPGYQHPQQWNPYPLVRR